MDFTVIDTVRADTLDVDDYIRFGGVSGKVLDFEDDGDTISLTVLDDNDGDKTDIVLSPEDFVDLLDYDYSGIEV
jgi:hypothetical protein